MTKTLAMFPGQGSQYVGMGRELLKEFPYLGFVFEEASDAAKINLTKLCFDGPEEELKLTANTQPAILTVSVATWKVLVEESGFSPDLFAGHSLGEYSALVACGKLSLTDAAALVRVRGEQMQQAVPAGKGAMSAVLNYSADQLVKDCSEVSSSLLASGLDAMAASVEIANYNSEKQLIVSGGSEAVASLTEKLKAGKVRVVPLPVSAPFHSKLMKPARDAMTPLLNEVAVSNNASKIIPNITAKVCEDYTIESLISQIDGPVLWMQSLQAAVEYGCESYVEVGPGKVLAGIAKRSLEKGASIHTTDPVQTFLN